jgi:hypothetical protein
MCRASEKAGRREDKTLQVEKADRSPLSTGTPTDLNLHLKCSLIVSSIISTADLQKFHSLWFLKAQMNE